MHENTLLEIYANGKGMVEMFLCVLLGDEIITKTGLKCFSMLIQRMRIL